MPVPIVRDPIYQQLNRALRERLRSEDYRTGDRFMTERQIGEQFNVSRATANKALSNLVSEGLLEFRKGLGTFVREGLIDYDLRGLVSFTDKARAVGKQPGTRVMTFREIDGAALDPEVAHALDLKPDDRAYWMQRLRLADGEPVILERRVVRADLCPDLHVEDLRRSLYALWSERYELDIAGADQTIHAVNLNAEDARALNARENDAALRAISTGFLHDGRPLWWEDTLYRADAYSFQNRLGALRRARPAVGRLTTEPAA